MKKKKMPQPLTITEIKELLKKNQSRGRLARAASHESRLRLHGTLNLDITDARSTGVALNDFLSWWEGVLSKPEKFQLFTQLFRFPIPTVAFLSKVFAALEKVYDGRNPVQQYDFILPEVEGDWQAYREEKKLSKFFRRTVFDTVVEGRINSLVVVDLPSEQSGDLPEPYPYLLNTEHIYDYSWNGESFDWVAWKVGEDQLAFFDAFFYRIFKIKGDKITDTVFETPHDLGYTPVCHMWADPINNVDTDIKESPISKYLEELDWMLAYLISKRVNELTAQYPIYWGYSANCDYINEDPQKGVFLKCKNGVLVDGVGNYILDHRTRGIEQCPACANRRLLGAGSMVRKPFPDVDENDIGVPVGVVPAESISLEYNQAEVERLKSEIFTGVTGAESESVNNKAVNEKQVGAIVEGKTQALKNLKSNLEQVQKWTEETICRLRYGTKVFKGVTVNLGTEFHLYTADDLLAQYQTQRKEGADAATLDRLWEDYLSARYRNDPIVMERQRILMHLDPFRHKTPKEVKDLGFVSPELLFLKFNLSSLVMRFEREQTNIIDFGSSIQFDSKIEKIKQTLISYGKEITDTATSIGATSGNEQ